MKFYETKTLLHCTKYVLHYSAVELWSFIFCFAGDASSPSAPFLPPCRICGEKASGFHYGANTCEACKVSVKNVMAHNFS